MTQHVLWSVQTYLNQTLTPNELRLQSRRLLSSLLGEFEHDEQAHYLIDTRGHRGRPRRPVAFAINTARDVRRWPWSPVYRRLSISHIGQAITASVSNHRVGVDVVDGDLELSPGFSRMWFDERERNTMGELPLHAFWAAREASYKAHCRCDTFCPRQWKITAVTKSKYQSDIVYCQVSKTPTDHSPRTAYVRLERRGNFQIALATVTANPVLEELSFPSNLLQTT